MPPPACSGLLPFLRLVSPVNELKPLSEQRQAPIGLRSSLPGHPFWWMDNLCNALPASRSEADIGLPFIVTRVLFTHPTKWMVYTEPAVDGTLSSAWSPGQGSISSRTQNFLSLSTAPTRPPGILTHKISLRHLSLPSGKGDGLVGVC